MYQLVIAEKPSVAQAIASVLGAKNKKDGYLEGNGYLVSWCVGHLVELGNCPWCGSSVYESRVSYRCSSRDCTFCLWKDSAFLNGLKKPITKKMAIDFLQSGRVHAKGLYSTRTGKNFDADILLTETTDKRGKRISSYKLEFPSQKRQP